MIIAEVVRSGFVESVHHGSVAVLTGQSRGDVLSPIFPRSSNKPMQTVGMLRAGLVPRDGADLALISGSHYGEPFHARRVREILEGAGLTVADLRCPAALPIAEKDRDDWVRSGGGPERVLMNCSGKHAGMLATCAANDWPLETYLDPKHPLQVAIAEAVADLAGEPVAATGVDGCGAPVLAVSLTGLARAFQRLVEAEPGSAERRVADEMRAHPELVAGTGADDTVLMGAVPGLLAKGGAEGVVAAAVPGAGAIAIKVDDGGMRARTPVLLDELRRLGVTVPVMTELVLGGGEPVGEVRAVR
ncbi:asparaginase [Paractinoplanes atraurantiacus]|uniref:Asparaginase n=1 Tax=Paractinoplanes atraurantiacus TaxID=1036182 RepID=A0A285F3M5_9ACTN|nr:asparaginase [Actinoplanes atraurantiacus]SNY04966.1 asparaginase [Actinoplanes atraurantiacus]